MQTVSAVDDAALGASFSEVLSTTVAVVAEAPQVSSRILQVPLTCSKGKWCTAGVVVNCSLGSYNPLANGVDGRACHLCPLNSQTTAEASTQKADCLCMKGFYDASDGQAIDAVVLQATNVSMMAAEVDCQPCREGYNTCAQMGTTSLNLIISTGYYRHSVNWTTAPDVRRCSDARVNCNVSGCPESTSGCRRGAAGRATSSPCEETLTGPFCELCAERSDGARIFYVAASYGANAKIAHCSLCGDGADVIETFVYWLLIVVSVGTTALALFAVWTYCLTEKTRGWLVRMHDAFTLPNKAKSCIGFYQIAVQIPRVYEVRFPDALQALINAVERVPRPRDPPTRCCCCCCAWLLSSRVRAAHGRF